MLRTRRTRKKIKSLRSKLTPINQPDKKIKLIQVAQADWYDGSNEIKGETGKYT